MESEIVEQVTDWESQSFSGGYDGLRDLADAEFTGAVTEGTAWLFFLNGRVVGVFEGSLDRFESADGTTHRAPDPSLPLLFTMLETGGETKAQYYTEDTSLSSADGTLSSGNFTGYVELSENVLSGDYYVVYYGGRKLPCAYVGASRDLLTGEEAFERAADEVGIYEVIDVDVEITELPDPPEPEPDADSGGRGASETEAGEEADTEPKRRPAEAGGDDAGRSDEDGVSVSMNGGAAARHEQPEGGVSASGDDPAEGARSEPSRSETTSSGSADAATRESADTVTRESADATQSGRTPPGVARQEGRPDSARDGHRGDTPASETVSDRRTESSSRSDRDDNTGRQATVRDGEPATDSASEPVGPERDRREEVTDERNRSVDARDDAPAESTDAAQSGDATQSIDPDIQSEREWRETRTIPSLDPADSSTDGKPSGTGVGETGGNSDKSDSAEATTSESSSGASSAGTQTRDGSAGRSRHSSGGRSDAERTRLRERVEELEAARQEARAELSEARATAEARSEEIDRLEAENEQLSSEISDLRAERDRLEAEVSDLEAEVSDLEAEVSDLREQLAELEAQQPDGDHEVTAPKALSGTNLFVRYDAKSGPTLETAHAETATRAEVEDNLRIETHTDFEKEGAIVEDKTYLEFLRSTIEFNFVDWVVHELLYELQETGAEGKLRDLYDAIPKVDRAELHGVVEIYDEAAEVDTERPFDVILRDRMGDPLVVANVMDTREATMEPEVDELVSDARDVAQHRDSLGCAVYVTTSFFHPRALESATEETGGGLLSRNKRASYVKLGRKQGFHLGLVESREEGFHFTIPEL